jgi:hypothetical protein
MSPLYFSFGADYETAFLRALFWTVCSESAALGVALFFLRFKKRDFIASPLFSRRRILFAGFFASFATLPYLWFLFPRYVTSYFFYAFGGEALVITLEALFFAAYFSLPPGIAFSISLWCNAASLGVGKILALY